MNKAKHKLPRLALYGFLFFCLFHPFVLIAQSRFHFSVTTGYEITQGYAPGYDFTLLYNNGWGIRYTTIPGVKISEDTEIQENSDSVSAYKLKGNLEFPILLRTIDYRSFKEQSAIPFDFLTAYTGFGYNDITAELTEEEYTINSSELIQSVTKKNINVPTTFLVMGFYGGERFIVIDGKLIYFRGEANSNRTGGKQFYFDHWLIQISAGIGF
ncbi:MAG: hypothetical protein HN580_02540 [Deltaproteobacteria bacterium]|jgi:hypothetical protein|nr:hypothetical protein [Deltaproteobacteria bacterium]MBT4089844.1 hypothetical protein [Deltaproteobacteria bacterium]MBT4266301.1 hypothetical protein [Deltaproteobacteria bacterium]MBT4640011.1 hypothetical protein [Deltaproteobacteria bacterium]MBT6503104.1 hypothetical protein [Deltaproteobacteria bacterium]